MPHSESPSVSVSRGHRRLGSDPLRSVVWVRGEHDISTRVHLSDTIVRAAVLDDADIVVDLSGVTFLDASTVGAIVVAHNRLLAQARSLSVRAPSPPARRLLDLCGLAGLVEDRSAPGVPPVASALGSWVDVPAGDRSPAAAPSRVAREAPVREPARASERPHVQPAGSGQQLRAPS